MHELSQRFMFEAAHTLRRKFETEGSSRIHGHTYFAEVAVGGSPDRHSGMLVDLAVLRSCIERVRGDLDHRLLDEVPNLGAPTLENLCTYVAGRLIGDHPNLRHVRVWREASGDSCRLDISASVMRDLRRTFMNPCLPDLAQTDPTPHLNRSTATSAT
jgi:6-pyruvoyltetrahydropterin/6-carboxytetrahydropterin synthase